MIFFYFGSTDSYDTSERISLKFTICGQEIISLVKDERAVFLWSRDATIDYERYQLFHNWYYQSFSNMNQVTYPRSQECSIDKFTLYEADADGNQVEISNGGLGDDGTAIAYITSTNTFTDATINPLT